MKTTKLLPPTYLLIAVFAMIVLHFGFPGAVIIPPLWKLLGIVFIAVGITINIIADGKFHEVKTTVKPFAESSALVTSGMYGFTRNPMYLGFVLTLVGVAMLLGTLTPFAVVILFWIVMEKLFIEVEEKMLEAKFGSQWLKYKTSVRRWL
jgi:protein-S-isoprenylcysteine O-methyltransferase Ste14